MYVAVKGGERAIEAAHALLDTSRRGDPSLPELDVGQIRQQLRLAVDRVMAEGSLFDPDLAALAIKQAQGDLIEAIFLLRAYRTTLPRLAVSTPIDTATMRIDRRISATFKDLPGGQLLGPTFDYTHRLLNFDLANDLPPGSARSDDDDKTPPSSEPSFEPPAANGASFIPRVADVLGQEGLLESAPNSANNSGAGSAAEAAPSSGSRPTSPADTQPEDLTRHPLDFPASRALRLQNLARADEGFLLSLGYSTQRGYGRTHPFVGELRVGEVDVDVFVEELGFAITVGTVNVTECDMVNQFKGNRETPPQFTRGYGLAFGHSERKAMSMALVDRSLRATELGETLQGPAQDEEFVLSHSDNVQATGFVEHLKLPHYVDFQSELELVRKMRRAHGASTPLPGATTHGDEADTRPSNPTGEVSR